MRFYHFSILLFFVASVFLFTSCGDYVGKEKTHPFFIKAGACKSAGNYKEAAQYFEEFLNVCPRSPLTHYELASLYNDNLDDPFKAIYYYQRYLELDRNSPDSENVSKFIELSKRKIFDRLSKQFESAETSKAYSDAAKAKNLLDKYVEYATKLREQNTKLRTQNTEMRERILQFGRDSSKFKETVQAIKKQAEQAEQPDPQEPAKIDSKLVTDQKTDEANSSPDSWEKAKITASSPASSASSEEAAQQNQAQSIKKTVSTDSSVTSHKVASGDTLYNLSKKYYGSSKYWSFLLNANKDNVGKNGALRIGQIIRIPPNPAGEKK